MSPKKRSLDNLLALDKYEIDEQTHIWIDESLCGECQKRACLVVCPAQVYVLKEGKIVVRHENCLECGACTVACNALNSSWVDWRNPRGGFGIIYRYG